MECDVQPLAIAQPVPQPVSQPVQMVYNPHYGQQMQYQNNAYYPYKTHQSQMPVQQIPVQHTPIETTSPIVNEMSVNDPPAYPVKSVEELKPTETGQKVFTSENEPNSETIAVEQDPGIEVQGTVLAEDKLARISELIQMSRIKTMLYNVTLFFQ